MEQQDIHTVINQLNSEERMIIYGIFFENKTQTQMAEIKGISRHNKRGFQTGISLQAENDP